MNDLTLAIVKEARKHIGVKETAHNSGPYIDDWLLRVRRKPGNPWCVAFAWCMLDDACASLGIVLRAYLPPVAGGHLMIQMAKERKAWTDVPGPGFIFAIDHGTSGGGARLSHVGIVVELDGDRMRTIEGNTNEAGSREGNCVAAKSRLVSEATLGFLDPGLLVTRG